MQAEPITSELLQLLLESSSPEAYLSRVELPARSLASYAGELLKNRGMGRSEVIRAAGLNPTFGYQIFQGTRKAGRDNAIMLAFGLKCTLRETQRLLRLAGVSELWCKVRRDAIIMYCIDCGYTRAQCDDELYRLGEKTLITEERR